MKQAPDPPLRTETPLHLLIRFLLLRHCHPLDGLVGCCARASSSAQLEATATRASHHPDSANFRFGANDITSSLERKYPVWLATTATRITRPLALPRRGGGNSSSRQFCRGSSASLCWRACIQWAASAGHSVGLSVTHLTVYPAVHCTCYHVSPRALGAQGTEERQGGNCAAWSDDLTRGARAVVAECELLRREGGRLDGLAA